MTPILSLATLCLAAPVGYAGLRSPRTNASERARSRSSRQGEASLTSEASGTSEAAPLGQRGRLRGVIWAATSFAVLAAPWGLPDVPELRFMVSVCSVLAFMRLTETWLGKAPVASTRRFVDYLLYFTFFGEIRPHPPTERSWGRAMGARRVARSVAKGLALLGALALSTAWPDLWNSFVLRSVWCLWAGYFGATGTADLISGLQMMATGHGCAETFVLPIVARSPGDFWGRRWNLVFRNVAYRVLFQRIARQHGAPSAGAAVFLWSIVAHEYLVIATLQYSHGDMALFFGLQGVMTLLLSRIRRGQPWPTFVAVGAHWAWMIATAPLFFLPILQVFPVQSWRLW